VEEEIISHFLQQSYCKRDEESVLTFSFAIPSPRRSSFSDQATIMVFPNSIGSPLQDNIVHLSSEAGKVTVNVDPSPKMERADIAPPH
jgi:hypothetical protein